MRPEPLVLLRPGVDERATLPRLARRDRWRRAEGDARAARGRLVAVFRLGQLPLAGGHELEARRLGDERLDVPDAPQGNPFAVADPLADGGQVFDALDVAVRRPDDLRRVLTLELFRRRVPRLPGKPWQSEGDRARSAGDVLHA